MTMRPRPVYILLTLILFGAQAPAQIRENPEYQAALQALNDFLPSVAAEKLKRLYTTESAELSDEDKAVLVPRLLESLSRSGRAIEALAIASEEAVADHPAVPFWKAVALAKLGRFGDASALLDHYADQPGSPFWEEALLTQANLKMSLRDPEGALKSLAPLREAQAADTRLEAILKSAEIRLSQGNTEQAVELLAKLPESARTEDDRLLFLRGKIALAQGDGKLAEVRFRGLLNRENVTQRRILHGAHLGLADALALEDNSEEAIETLINFINDYPASNLLGAAFDRLEKYGLFDRERIHPAFTIWSESGRPELQALALYYGALAKQAANGPEAALPDLEAFRDRFPDHYLFPIAMMRLGRIHVETAKPDEAARLVAPLRDAVSNPSVKRYLASLEGEALFKSGRHDEAAQIFQGVAAGSNGAAPVFNSAVAALYAENQYLFQEELRRLGFLAEGREMQSNLMLERALHLASEGDSGAIAELHDFTVLFPDNPRLAEAELALAELYLIENPGAPGAAREQLEQVRQRTLTASMAQQADYLAIWIDAAAGNYPAVIEKGNAFLERWPDADKRAEVRMKLGEIYFQIKDFANAQTQFELIAEEEPEGPYAEKALYFAGKAAGSAMSTTGLNRAIELWGQVIDRGGALAEEARRQQAVAKLKQDQPDDALVVLDRLLQDRSRNQSPDLRMATLINRGQALLKKAESEENKEQMLIAAIGSFDQVLDSNEASRFWENQAAVHKGSCLEQMGIKDQALEVYFDVINRPPGTDPNQKDPPEYTWYYRAGFAAIRLLQERQEWKAAVRLAEKLAGTAGNRAGEAEELANRLRLEHFIWDEVPE